eukprot:11726647-Alexandrium_andersonii.AAC.1
MERAGPTQPQSRRAQVKPAHAWQRWAAKRRAGRDDGRPAPPKFPRRFRSPEAAQSAPAGERRGRPRDSTAVADMHVVLPESP